MRLSISPARLAVAPGEVARVEASVVNDGDLPLLPQLAVRGVDPDLVLRLDTGVELAPGEVGAAVVEVQVPADAVAGDLPFAVAVTDVDGLQEPQLVLVPVEVGGRPPVSVEVDPPTVRARRVGRLDTVLRNHGPTPLDLDLAGASEGADVRFVADRVRVGVGEAVAVATRIHRRRRTWFREVRHGILINVQGRGAPVAASTTFVQRPLLPAWLLKGTALLLILALWAGAVVVVRDRIVNPADTLATEDEGEGGADGDAGTGDEAAADDGDPPAGEDGGEEAADDEGEAEGEDAVAGPPVVLAGEVTGPRDPGGTRVIVERLGFGDEGTTGDDTKIAPQTEVAAPVGAVIDRIETETDDRGRFGLTSGLATSAFYRVAAVRQGFEVAAAVIRTEEEPAEYDVELVLAPTPGAMSGRVTGADGAPIGGAEVLISGGDLAYRTVTGSDGAGAGTWSIEGVAASPTYAVTFRAPRFASATVTQSLEGGQRLTGVDAELVPDLGSIRGVLSSRGEGVGAVTVDLLGDGVERSTTTLTADGVEGTFELPALPFGTYQLTFTAPGWLTQTTEVVVAQGDVVVAIGDLQASTATIQGIVEQEVAPGGCDYPDPAVPEQRDAAVSTPCGGVGVTLVGDAGTFSTTTATGTGSFTLSSIPPGTYTAAFERFGYQAQFLQVGVAAGDVLTLPDGAAGAAAFVRAAAVRSVAAAEGTPIIMRLVPPPTAAVGTLQGVLRSATDPSAVYEPPAGTVVDVVEQPDATAELLAEGAVRITGLVPGAVTLRVRAPGHDPFSVVVRVGGTVVAEAGTLLLTPLATLALRVTDSEELPIGDADVFLTTDDPAALADAVLDAAIDPDVDACTVHRDLAGRWRITDDPVGESLTGLCARVNAAGDVSFRQAVGTGSYRLITPVNEIDVADVDDLSALTPDERAARSRVVPLDHEQLERLVEVRSGETTRIDLRARRYAVFEGRIRKPSGSGFLNALASDFQFDVGGVITDGLAAFPALDEFADGSGALLPLGIGLTLLEDGTETVPPEGLRPRLSFGPDDGLPVGVYRINRVLPGEVTTTRDYELEFYGADAGNFGYRGTNALTSLGFAETRSANAVLLPSPVEVEIRVVRELRSGTAVEVEGADVSVSGIVEYVYDSGGLLPIVKTATGTSDVDGATVLRSGGDIQPYLESESLDITVTTEGFETLNVERVVPGDGEIAVVVTPLVRTVRGFVEIFPAGANVATTLDGLDVALETVGGATTESLDADIELLVTGGQLRFTIPNITPDDYRLVVSGDDVFDTTSGEPFAVPTGPVAVIATVGPDGGDPSPPPFLVDAELDLTVAVTESFQGPGETTPSSRVVPGATVQLRLNGTPIPPTPPIPTTGPGGEVVFPGLRGGDPADGARDYTLELTKPGYRPLVDDGPFTLETVDPLEARGLVRFGAARLRLISVLTASDTSHLVGATAALLDADDDPVEDAGGDPITFTSDTDGRVFVPSTLELEPRSYKLRITAASHDPETVVVPIADGVEIDLGDVELQLTRAEVRGTVTDGPVGSLPLANVRVQTTTAEGVFSDVTGADGRYSLPGLPPDDLVLVFEEFADAALTIPTSRRTHTLDVTPTPGEELVTPLVMAREFVAISGTASSRDFDDDDAPTTALVGATVTATCTSGDCLGASPTVFTTTTGPGGAYAFDVLNAGTYQLEFTADGHDTPAVRVAVVVRFTNPASAVSTAPNVSAVTIDQVLIATPIPVPVTADSDRAGIADLAGITVTATYVPADTADPLPTAGTDSRFVLTGVTGAAGEPVPLVLPPGQWTIATTGATAAATVPRPHRDGTESLALTADDDPTPVALVMAAYVEVSGTVRSRPHTNATSTPVAGATATPTPQTGAPAHPLAGVVPSTATDGVWSVLLPPTVAGSSATWEVVLAAAGHESAAVDVDLAVGDGDIALAAPPPAGVSLRALGDLAPAFHPGTGGVELTASPVAQPVLVTSAADGNELDGVTVVATWDSTDPAPPAAAAYTTTRASGTSAVDLLLAPGPWLLTTTGADTAAGLPARPPHQDAPGTSVAPAIGAASPTETLDLVRWASITGDVRTEAFSGAAFVSPTDATAVVTVPATGVAESGTNADGVPGQWRVWIEDPADATVTLSKSGFVADTADVVTADFAGDRDLTLGTPVTLTAAERVVAVTVASSVTGGVTDGATVVATDPAGDVANREAVVVAGVATFTGGNALEPIEWEFTTTDAVDLPEPHKELGSASTPAVRRTIPAGTGTYTLDSSTPGAADERFVLTRYALVSGTIGTRNYDSDLVFVPTDGIAVAASTSGGGAIAAPASGVGETGGWQVWLPDPALVSIQFSKSGYTTRTIPVSAATTGRDIELDTPVTLIATPRIVEVKVVSAADGSDLSGIEVTANADPDGNGVPDLTAHTVVTNPSGVARFENVSVDRRLAPAEWTFTTNLAPAHDPPHKDLTTGDAEDRVIPVGTGTLSLSSTTDGAEDERLELIRYAEVTGTVRTQDYAGGPTPASDAPTMIVTAPASGAVDEQPGTDATTGKWRVWVPDPTTVAVRFELDGYADDTSSVAVGDFDAARTAGAPDATVVGVPREVRVKVVSSDGSNLGGVEVTATSPAGVFKATTVGSGIARFRDVGTGNGKLAPTTWTFTTTGGAGLSPPHEDLTTGPPDTSEVRAVEPGTSFFQLDDATGPRAGLTLTKYAFISGVVSTRGASDAPATPAESATVTETTSTNAQITSPTPTTSPPGTWSAWVPEGASPTFEFSKTAYGTESEDYPNVTGTRTDADVVLTAGTRPVTITAVDSTDVAITFSGVDITLTGAALPILPDHGPATTGAGGVADFGSIEPIEYVVTTSGAAAFGRKDLVTGDNVTLTVDPGTTTQALDLPLVLDTLPPAITGDVVEYRNGAPVTIDGVVVTGTRGAEVRPMGASTTAAADNYSLQLPAGTWRLTAERTSGGPTVVVDEAYVMPTDGTGPAPTVVMPTADGPDLSGTVTTSTGDPVDGATIVAVSSAQTRSTTSDESGLYELVGLDPDVTWAVTYTPPAGVGGVPVTRYVAPGGSSTDIPLPQAIPASLGSIQVDVTDGPPSTTVTVTLTETGTPYKTLDEDGIITDTVALNASGAGSVTFPGLVPGDGGSIPNDRFEVSLDVPDYESFSDTGNEVTGGSTLVVDAPLVASPRTVVLTLTDDATSGPITAVTPAPSLLPDPGGMGDDRVAVVGAELDATTAPGVWTFTGVAPGDWDLDVVAYDTPVDVLVPVGSGDHTDAFALTASLRDVTLTLDDGTAAVTGESPTLTRTGFTDVGGTESTTTPGDYTFSGVRPGDWTLEVAAHDDESVSVPVGTGAYATSVTLTPSVRDVVLSLSDGGGAVTGAAPTLIRTGFTDVGGTESTTTPGDYTFSGVRPGDWTLQVATYADESVSVPVGVGSYATSVTLS